MRSWLKNILIIVFVVVSTMNVQSQIQANNADSLIFENYKVWIKQKIHLPINEFLVNTALYFQNRPYVAGTLEQKGNEHLVINLRELDCTTFVENCVALTLTMKSADPSFAHYRRILQMLRYRNGVIDDYSSRLHYSSDWIYENARNKFWKDETLALGGTIQNKELNFMSTHPQAYPAMKNDTKMLEKIKGCETAINNRKCYALLSKELISSDSTKLKDGDIVLFGTKIDGLDFSHMGIIYINKGIVTFTHASSAAMKVIIQPTSLAEYCSKSKNCDGIAILRLNGTTN